MAFISVTGEPGCRAEELARLVSRKLDCELLTETSLATLIARDFEAQLPPAAKAWPDIATSVLAHMGVAHHVVISAVGSEMLLPNFAGVLRIHLTASEPHRAGDLMIHHRADRTEARRLLREMKGQYSALRKSRFGTAAARLDQFDLVLNCANFVPEQLVALIEQAAVQKQLFDIGLLSSAAEAQIQFQLRLRLAKFGLVPSDRPRTRKREFGHPSEEIFANMLDFYRVVWEYEPRTFALEHDASGKVTEAFTPDFYLPEQNLYVELTTMKQALVTRKNRKIRLLKALHPEINIQVFYQKDLQDLVMKYGLPEKTTP